ncbi:MAG: hypothetical protein Rubg2KO_30560 [Rubricoccaceae bacterium]
MRPFILSLGFALILGMASSASAQETATAVPDWAAPSAPMEPSGPAAESMMNPPNPPGAPTQVPLDGGLGLLALAGGAYAAKKLRERQSE